MIEFRGASTNAVNGGDSVSIVPHADTRDGDLMIALQVVGGGTLPSAVPSGWTRLRPQLHWDEGGDRYGEILYRLADDEDLSAGYTFGAAASADITVAIVSYEVVDPDGPIDVEAENENTSGTTHTAPSVDATLDSGLLVCAYAIWGDSGNCTVPAGMTERVDYTAEGVDASVYVCDKQLSAGGATGSQDAVSTNAHGSIGVAAVLDTMLGEPGAITPRLVEGGLKFGLD